MNQLEFKSTRQESIDDFWRRLSTDKKSFSIKTVTFQLTESCNLNCSYCYQTHKTNNKMKFETAKMFIDLILAEKNDKNEFCNKENADGVVIDFIGGEPLLESELMEQITEYFITQAILLNHPWAKRFRVSISSNGTLYFSDAFQKYLKKYGKYISLSITIDGNKKLHDKCRLFPDGSGSYDLAIAAVDHYRKFYHMETGSKMTLAPENINYVYEAVVNMIEKDYHDINLNCVFEDVWNISHANVLYYQLKQLADYIIDNEKATTCFVSMFNKNLFCPIPEEENRNYCGASGHMLAVNYKGEIFPCIRFMESSLSGKAEPYKIGTVENGIAIQDEEKQRLKCLNCLDRKCQSTEECFYCPIGTGCAWCTAHNYQACGSVDKRATFICKMHRAVAAANAYFWNKLYQHYQIQDVFKIHLPEEWALEFLSLEEWNTLKQLEIDNVKSQKEKEN